MLRKISVTVLATILATVAFTSPVAASCNPHRASNPRQTANWAYKGVNPGVYYTSLWGWVDQPAGAPYIFSDYSIMFIELADHNYPQPAASGKARVGWYTYNGSNWYSYYFATDSQGNVIISHVVSGWSLVQVQGSKLQVSYNNTLSRYTLDIWDGPYDYQVAVSTFNGWQPIASNVYYQTWNDANEFWAPQSNRSDFNSINYTSNVGQQAWYPNLFYAYGGTFGQMSSSSNTVYAWDVNC